MKKFKVRNNSIIPYLIIIFINLILLKNLASIKIVNSNEELISKILANRLLLNFKLNINPYHIIKERLLYDDQKYIKEILNYNYENNENPIIYIYNENNNQKFNSYDIILASYILSNKLNITSYVEKTNFEDLNELNDKNIINDYIDKYNPKLVINIRLGNNEKIKIKNKNYAFINLYSNNKLLNKYFKKDFININEDNDLDINTIIIQIGNENTTLEEMINSLEEVAKILEKYIGEING